MWNFNNSFEAPNKSGVYAILNTLNNKKYVGSTCNFKLRFSQHKSLLRRGTHKNVHLQNAYNKYGEKYFMFVILEECENIKDTLNFVEQKYIDSDGDYNICPIANRRTYTKMSDSLKEKLIKIHKGRKRSKETCKRISEALKGHVPTKEHLINQSKGRKGKGTKRVEQYDINGNYITTYNSLTEAAEAINRSYVGINQCCKGKLHSAYGYYWKYEKDNRNILDVIKPLDNIRNKRPIYQIDKKSNEIINEFESIKAAAIAVGGLSKRFNINRCCYGSRKSAFGYKWKYKDE